VIKHYVLQLFFPAAIFISFLIFYLNYVYIIPIRYDDEASWIGRSYFFQLFIRGDFNNRLWQTELGYEETKLQQYLFGLWLYPKHIQYKKQSPDLKPDFAMFLIANNFYLINGENTRILKTNLHNLPTGIRTTTTFRQKC